MFKIHERETFFYIPGNEFANAKGTCFQKQRLRNKLLPRDLSARSPFMFSRYFSARQARASQFLLSFIIINILKYSVW